MFRPCRRRTRRLVPRLFAAVAACLPASGFSQAATTATIGGVVPPQTAEPTTRTLHELPPVHWSFERSWTLSSDDVLFGSLIDVDQLGDGDLAFTDGRLGQVLLVGRDGRLRRVIEVVGEGPGRLTRLDSVCELPGEGLFLVQSWPGRGEAVDIAGQPLRSLRSTVTGNHGGAPTWIAFASGYGQIVGVVAEVRHEQPQTADNRLRLTRFDPATLEMGTDVLRREFVTVSQMGLIDETVGYFPQNSWAIVGEREVVVAPERERYLLELHDRDRGLLMRYERPRRPVPRCQAEIERLQAGFSLEVNGQRQAITFVMHETAEMIQAITVQAPRRLLLRTAYFTHALPDGITARFDLVDLDAGTFREVWLRVPHDRQADRLVPLPDGNLVVLTGAWPGGPGPDTRSDAGLQPPTIQFWTRHGGAR